MTAFDELRAAVRAEAAVVADAGQLRTEPALERPREAGHGDYATNAALVLAKVAGAPPRELAQRLAEALAGRLGPTLDRAEIAGPGFINLFLADAWFAYALATIVAAGDGFGASDAGAGVRVNLEFVSANPTGPLTAASGRHAAYGDALARTLELAGHEVVREYYVNDTGMQVDKLGESIRARARGEEPPQDGYQGDYVRELAHALPGAAELGPGELARRGVELMFERIKAVLHEYRVDFDEFFSEARLHSGDPSAIASALARLEDGGLLYRADGARWLRTTDFGDDKDRVVVRSTGQTTYFAADVAYLGDKLGRGFDRLIVPIGADHHGYMGRMRAVLAAIGESPERLEMPILQFVHVVEGGARASMSKRRGEFVALEELIGEIGVDATRFMMLQRSHDSTLDLDLDLAREQSAENPVYYVQYAHARIAGLLRKAGIATAAAPDPGDGPGAPLHASERALVVRLLAFPEEIAEAAERRAPHRIAAYALDLAQTFTAFYRDCPVVGAEPESLEHWRLMLAMTARDTLARALGVLGVSAPDEM